MTAKDTSKSWLDKLPPAVRHTLIITAGVLLAWVAPKVSTLPEPLPQIIGGVLLPMATLTVTKLTKQYGIKK